MDFRSYMGPGDSLLPNSEVSGYQPVSRIGEIVMNAFVDPYEFDKLKPTGTDPKPHFHEWATVQPGMITLSRKKKESTFRNYVAAETAVPVIVCAACLKEEAEESFFFSGISRSKSVRSIDDGIGPREDEFFTVSIGGMQTLLNNSGRAIKAGQFVKWSLEADGENPNKRKKTGPRRVVVTECSDEELDHPRIIGRALSFAKNGEPFDILIKQ